MAPLPGAEPDSSNPERKAVTLLLRKVTEGDPHAFDALLPLVYDQLRRLAARNLGSQAADHTLQATALVHEAYLKLADANGTFQDRAHFYAVAARVMRNILVDHARAAKRQKRGAGARHMVLDEAVMVGSQAVPELADLDESLRRLEAKDQRKGKVIELLFFGGLTYAETAAVLAISEATVHRELKMAKAWLYNDLAAEPIQP